jgi:nitroreductase
MSVCPTEAVVVEGYDYRDFTDLPDRLPSLNDFEILLKARRSTRRYQDKPVPRELIQKIIDAASLAPISIPPHRVEITVLDSKGKVAELVPPVIKELRNWINLFSNPAIRLMMRMMIPASLIRAMVDQIIPLSKGIVLAASEGKDYLAYDAPALFLFHANKNQDCYLENCVIAYTYAMIAAEGLGLGSCINGMIPPAIDHNKKLRKKYGIPKQNQVCGCLLIGYAKSTFNRSIPRKFKSVDWI